jgi:hypothetical protein
MRRQIQRVADVAASQVHAIQALGEFLGETHSHARSRGKRCTRHRVPFRVTVEHQRWQPQSHFGKSASEVWRQLLAEQMVRNCGITSHDSHNSVP